jgi:hypothetical protein
MKSNISTFFIALLYAVQLLSFGVVYAQTKPSAPSIIVYKTPT